MTEKPLSERMEEFNNKMGDNRIPSIFISDTKSLEAENQKLKEQYRILEEHHIDQSNYWVEAFEKLKTRLSKAQALIEKWRERFNQEKIDGGYDICADELESALRGGVEAEKK